MLYFFYCIFSHNLLTAESFPCWCIQKCSYIKSGCQETSRVHLHEPSRNLMNLKGTMWSVWLDLFVSGAKMLKHVAMLQQKPLKNIFIYIWIELWWSLFDTLIWHLTHFILLNSAVHSGPKRLGWKRGIYWTPRSERRSWTFWSTRRERPARSEGENENSNNYYIQMHSKLLWCDVTEQ